MTAVRLAVERRSRVQCVKGTWFIVEGENRTDVKWSRGHERNRGNSGKSRHILAPFPPLGGRGAIQEAGESRKE